MITCPHCGKAISIGPQQLNAEGQTQRWLLNEIETVERIFNLSGTTWEYKYDRIFNIGPGIRKLIEELGISFEWYDPDTSYEEDVTYYVEALQRLKTNLESELKVE